MTEQVDCAVIGAGVVGLAIARAFAIAGREVIVLEAADAIGTHTSSRNSEVIHAGLYYPKGSLKARFCVSGKTMLYDYCSEHGVPHRNIGKVVVAVTEDEIPTLQGYVGKAEANGVQDLRWLSREELRELEPAVDCVAGFFSPSTGIIDSHALMLAYQGDAENGGATVVFKSPVESGTVGSKGITLNVGGDDPMTIDCRSVVNSAGLFAQNIALSIEGVPAQSIPPQYFAKAHYYTLSGKPPFKRLVYPRSQPCPSRSPCDRGPRRPGAFRSGRILGRFGGLQFRSLARNPVLRSDPQVLPGSQGRPVVARLHRHSSQSLRPERSRR